MATTKRELIVRIAAKTGVKQTEVRQVVQSFLDEIVADLAKGLRLEFREFGIFEVQEKKARMGHNPRTGEAVEVPARRRVRFTPGNVMRALVNGEEARTGTPSESASED